MTRIYYDAHTSMGMGHKPKASLSSRIVKAWKRGFFTAFSEENGSWLAGK